MRYLITLALLVHSVALAQTPPSSQVGPVTIGPVVRLGKADGGTLPPPTANNAGGLIYDVLAQRAMLSDGGKWTYLAHQDEVTTRADATYYLDPAGTDTNPCTAAAPCSWQGAFDKVPPYVNHQLVMSVAAGSYTGGVLLGKTFSSKTGAGIRVQCATPTNFTPATGTATGTLTAVTTGGIAESVVTDSTQTWTTDDLATSHLTLVSGTGSGQVLTIVSNTATQIVTAGTFSPQPTAGTTYAVTRPASTITTSVNAPATATTVAGAARGLIIAGITTARAGATSISIEDCAISGAFQSIGMNDAQGVTFLRGRFTPTNTTGFSASGTSAVTFSRSVISSGSGVALLPVNTAGSTVAVTLSQSLLTSSSTSGTIAATVPGYSVLASTSEIVNTSNSGIVAYLAGGSVQTFFNSCRIRCAATSTNFGVYLPGIVSSGSSGSGQVVVSASQVQTCGTGLFVRNTGQTVLLRSSTGFENNTTGMAVYGGAVVSSELNMAQFSGCTVDMRVGGATSSTGGVEFTRAEFLALCASPGSSSDCSYTEWSSGSRVHIPPG